MVLKKKQLYYALKEAILCFKKEEAICEVSSGEI